MSKKFVYVIIVITLISILLTDVTAFAAGTPTITVGSASGKPGETVSIPVTIENNSGIIALYCDIAYDDSQLKLTKVTNGNVLEGPGHSGSLTTNPYRLCFDMSLAPANNTKNGVIVTLQFEIIPAAKTGETAITITYDPEEIYDYNLKNVNFEKRNGKISINSGNNNGEPSPTSNPKQNNTTDTSSSKNGDKIEVDIIPNDKTPWDKVIIGGNTDISNKNITTEQTEEGLIIRGNDLSGVTIEIQKDGKKASVDVNTDQKEVLIKENENDEVEVYVDANNDGNFDVPIIEPIAFHKTTDNLFSITIIILSLTVVAVISGFVFFIIKRRKQMPKK